jgi:hypothetical protein
MKFAKKILAVFASSCLVLGAARDVFADQTDPPGDTPVAASLQTPEQLQQLVAPIALYPDSLVAQILTAAANSIEIVEADRWMQAHSDLQGEELAAEVNKQSWDPSVKALTEFPAVLANLDKNLPWTSALGDTYMSQPQALMAAVQAMRQRAEAAGNLNSTEQEDVTTQGQAITIEPADPEMVYVPEYDPWQAYGEPVPIWPGWYPYSGLYLDGPGIAFGLGFGLWFFGGYEWGWHHWRSDWHHRTVDYHHSPYMARSHTLVAGNTFFHENLAHAPGTYNTSGLFGGTASRALLTPQRTFAASHGAFGAFGGRGGAGEMGHGGGFHEGGFHGGGFHGGGFHGGGFNGGGGHR